MHNGSTNFVICDQISKVILTVSTITWSQQHRWCKKCKAKGFLRKGGCINKKCVTSSVSGKSSR